MSAPLSMPTLEDVESLRTQVEALARRQDATERALSMPPADLDRVMGVIETARAIGKSPVTLRHCNAPHGFRTTGYARLWTKGKAGSWFRIPADEPK